VEKGQLPVQFGYVGLVGS